MTNNTSIDVVAGILWRGEQYLAVQRPEGKALAGWWEFPGGKVERGEDKAAALIRELAEELGVRATNPHFWQSVHHGYASTAAREQSPSAAPTRNASPNAATAPSASPAAAPHTEPGPHTGARQVHVHFYHVHNFCGEPHPREGQTLRWVTPTEGLNLPFLAADIPIVERLHTISDKAKALPAN